MELTEITKWFVTQQFWEYHVCCTCWELRSMRKLMNNLWGLIFIFHKLIRRSLFLIWFDIFSRIFFITATLNNEFLVIFDTRHHAKEAIFEKFVKPTSYMIVLIKSFERIFELWYEHFFLLIEMVPWPPGFILDNGALFEINKHLNTILICLLQEAVGGTQKEMSFILLRVFGQHWEILYMEWCCKNIITAEQS